MTTKNEHAQFAEKWFKDAFYWVNADNFAPLQKIAFEMGLQWFTGDTDVSEFQDQKNLVMFDTGKIQSVDFWIPNAFYGTPKDYNQMILEYNQLYA